MQEALQHQMNLSLHLITLRPNTYIYKRTFCKVDGELLSKYEWQWFALEPGYGSEESYGPVVTTWKLDTELRLLDISSMSKRRVISRLYNISLNLLDCNDQYSGGGGNTQVHLTLLPVIAMNNLDGTYINEKVSDDECDGPTEVVINRNSISKISKM